MIAAAQKDKKNGRKLSPRAIRGVIPDVERVAEDITQSETHKYASAICEDTRWRPYSCRYR
jgi:hypothetical protein